jgi:hypothetical protein
MSNATSRREVLAGAAAVVGVAALPALPARTWIKPYPLGDRPTAQQWEDREDRNQPWARAPEMLTPSELQTLRRKAKETSAFAQKVYPTLKMVGRKAGI